QTVLRLSWSDDGTGIASPGHTLGAVQTQPTLDLLCAVTPPATLGQEGAHLLLEVLHSSGIDRRRPLRINCPYQHQNGQRQAGKGDVLDHASDLRLCVLLCKASVSKSARFRTLPALNSLNQSEIGLLQGVHL